MLYLAAAVIIVYNYTFFITICSHYRQASIFFDKIQQMSRIASLAAVRIFNSLSKVKG